MCVCMCVYGHFTKTKPKKKSPTVHGVCGRGVTIVRVKSECGVAWGIAVRALSMPNTKASTVVD